MDSDFQINELCIIVELYCPSISVYTYFFKLFNNKFKIYVLQSSFDSKNAKKKGLFTYAL